MLYFLPKRIVLLFAGLLLSHVLAAQSPWSQAASWGRGTKPVAGEDVVIPEGQHILLDESPPALGSLTIRGTLEFARQDLALAAGYIFIHFIHGGELIIGTEAQPFAHQAPLTLTDPDTAFSVIGHIGTRGIFVNGCIRGDENHGTGWV